MPVNRRSLRAPMAAFAMAMVLVLYVRSSIQTARAESGIRQRKELERVAEEKREKQKFSGTSAP